MNGSCNYFAVSLRNIFNYNVYVIEQKDKKGFLAFCQTYKNRQCYYIDVRGITSSFNEFLAGINTFVGDEFIIRPMEEFDLYEWEKDFNYNSEAYEFSEVIIKQYRELYIL